MVMNLGIEAFPVVIGVGSFNAVDIVSHLKVDSSLDTCYGTHAHTHNKSVASALIIYLEVTSLKFKPSAYFPLPRFHSLRSVAPVKPFHSGWHVPRLISGVRAYNVPHMLDYERLPRLAPRFRPPLYRREKMRVPVRRAQCPRYIYMNEHVSFRTVAFKSASVTSC